MKKIIAMLTVLVVAALAGCGGGGSKKVVLITMDSSDRHWVSVDAGAKEAAEKLGNIEYKWMAPDKKDDAQQIERINNAVADGAAVIGGVSTLGGTGLLSGVIVGAGIWGVLQNGLQFAGAPVAIRNIVIGVIVVISVLLDVVIRTGQKKKAP